MADRLIEQVAGFSGHERPTIKGTRVRVSDIAQLCRVLEDESMPERIQRALPHLDLAQVEAALEYWKTHAEEIEAEIEEEQRLFSELSSGQ